MSACSKIEFQILIEPSAQRKLARIDEILHRLLLGDSQKIPDSPGRDVQILPIRDLPPKKGLASKEGQARLLHDLASIELQAMELCLRTLAEFPEAPQEFREQLAVVAREEGYHLSLCLKGLDDLGFPWGSWPIHIGLWQSVSREDSLLDRILIVHRYLEGSGLDASDTLLRRLLGVNAKEALTAVQVICRDEVAHVRFGSHWYQKLIREQGGDPDRDFVTRLDRLFVRVPRRLEPIQKVIRQDAGFSDAEIIALEYLRSRWLNPAVRMHPELQS